MATRAKKAGGASLAGWLALAVLVMLLDQFTKTLVAGWFQLGDVRPVTGFFNLVRVHNAGAAFSFLAGASGWQRWFFVGFGVLASLGEDLKFVLITSAVTIAPGESLAVQVTPSGATKCERCWHWRDDVGHDLAHPTICGRCTSNLYGAGEARAVA